MVCYLCVCSAETSASWNLLPNGTVYLNIYAAVKTSSLLVGLFGATFNFTCSNCVSNLLDGGCYAVAGQRNSLTVSIVEMKSSQRKHACLSSPAELFGERIYSSC